MQVSWIDAPSEQVSSLQREWQRSGTWDEFVASLGSHVAGDKTGRIFFPFAAVWNDGETTQRRAGAHERQGCLWSLVCLDLDHCTTDQVMTALERLDAGRYLYVCHTTHSYDPAGAVKTRIWMPLAMPIARDAVPQSRMRTAAWLGLDTDKATKGPHMGFFTPRAPAELLEHAWTIARTGAAYGPLYFELLPELGEEPGTNGGLKRAPTGTQRPRVVVAPRPMDQWPEAPKAAAEAHLQGLAKWTANDRSTHTRERLKSGVTLLAGYAASGIIEAQHVFDTMAAALTERSKLGRDDQSLAWRLKQLSDFMDWGEVRPILPEGFTADGELDAATASVRAADPATRLQAQLILQTPEKLYTAAEAAHELHSFLRLPRGLQRWLGVVEVSVGVGKTHGLRQLAAERAERGEYTVILSLDHGLLGQIRRDLERAGVAVRHLHSLQQSTERTGSPSCAIAHRPDVAALTANGVSLAGSVCPKCSLRAECPAVRHNRRKLREYVLLAPYQMARRALGMIADANDSPTAPLLVCDEEPPPPERVLISVSAIQEAVDNELVWRTLRSDQANDVQSLCQFLIRGDIMDAPDELVQAVAQYYGQLHAPDMTLMDLERNQGAIEAIKDVLRIAQGWSTLTSVVPRGETEDHWQCAVSNAAWQALADDGGFVLSATPDYALYENFPLPIQHLTLRVSDHQPASRLVLLTRHASRSQVMEDGNIDWSLVQADLDEVFRLVPRGRLLVGTYKAVSDALKTTQKHILRGRDVALTHYEVVRGRDDWRDREAFVSLYDPRIPAETFAASTDAAARTLEQFHGRARDPQPRAAGAIHIHVGCVAPTSWWLDEKSQLGDGRARVQQRETGRPPEPLATETMNQLRAYLTGPRS